LRARTRITSLTVTFDKSIGEKRKECDASRCHRICGRKPVRVGTPQIGFVLYDCWPSFDADERTRGSK